MRKEKPFRGANVTQLIKNLPAMQETQVWSLGGEDPLEEEMVILSSILAWEITWTEEPGGLHAMRLWRVRHGWTIKPPMQLKIQGKIQLDC